MRFNELKEKPTAINNVHQSCYRAFSILQDVKEMIKRKDSVETISEYIEFAESFENLAE